jgi:hypothetical protein
VDKIYIQYNVVLCGFHEWWMVAVSKTLHAIQETKEYWKHESMNKQKDKFLLILLKLNNNLELASTKF